PLELRGTDRVESVLAERTRLDADGRLQGTGETEEIPAGLVLRSIGYRGVPLPGLPFDEAAAVLPHRDGRVVGPGGAPLPGVYTAGWAKRGATGVIGTNKSDAAGTVRSLLDDAAALRAGAGPRAGLEELLEGSGA